KSKRIGVRLHSLTAAGASHLLDLHFSPLFGQHFFPAGHGDAKSLSHQPSMSEHLSSPSLHSLPVRQDAGHFFLATHWWFTHVMFGSLLGMVSELPTSGTHFAASHFWPAGHGFAASHSGPQRLLRHTRPGGHGFLAEQ